MADGSTSGSTGTRSSCCFSVTRSRPATERRGHTLGAQLAQRIVERTNRAVRLHAAAHVGSETSILRAQVARFHRVRGRRRRDLGRWQRRHPPCQDLGLQTTPRASGELASKPRHPGGGRDLPGSRRLSAIAQPLRTLARTASGNSQAPQREVVTELGGRAVSLADVVGPFFITQP